MMMEKCCPEPVVFELERYKGSGLDRTLIRFHQRKDIKHVGLMEFPFHFLDGIPSFEDGRGMWRVNFLDAGDKIHNLILATDDCAPKPEDISNFKGTTWVGFYVEPHEPSTVGRVVIQGYPRQSDDQKPVSMPRHMRECDRLKILFWYGLRDDNSSWKHDDDGQVYPVLKRAVSHRIER